LVLRESGISTDMELLGKSAAISRSTARSTSAWVEKMPNTALYLLAMTTLRLEQRLKPYVMTVAFNVGGLPIRDPAHPPRNPEGRCSMRQRIHHEVHAHPQPQLRAFGGVLRMIRILVGISQVVVERDGHHHPLVVIQDGAPVGQGAVLAVSAAAQGIPVGDLAGIVEVIHRVEQRMIPGQLEIGRA